MRFVLNNAAAAYHEDENARSLYFGGDDEDEYVVLEAGNAGLEEQGNEFNRVYLEVNGQGNSGYNLVKQVIVKEGLQGAKVHLSIDGRAIDFDVNHIEIVLRPDTLPLSDVFNYLAALCRDKVPLVVNRDGFYEG